MTPLFGSIFSEQIHRSSGRRRSSTSQSHEDEHFYIGRHIFVAVILVCGVGLLLAKLFTLTLIEGKQYRKLSQENRTREINIQAARGIMYDRNNVPLVHNIPVFETSDGTLYFEKKPATISSEIVERVGREYDFADTLAHALGYVGEIDTHEIEGDKKGLYKPGDFVGKIGVEEIYDQRLRGIDGKELVEVDARGNKIRSLGKISPKPGGNLLLSLSSHLGTIAKAAMDGKKGAIIATVPSTGEVLVLYSSPSFDPNMFVRNEGLEEIFSDPNQPLFNRGISGQYHPGSTFKIVVSIAGLESGSITRQMQVEDTGVLTVGAFSFGNWYFSQYGKTEGFVDLVTAIKRSNDIYFYKAGEAIGIETIAGWAKKIGVGKKLGIDIYGEERGLMPDPDWQKTTRGEPWYLGNTYHVAIGQGDVLATPLQVNAWTNLIANRGRLCVPHLLKQETNNCQDFELKTDTIGAISEGMQKACEPGGTGWPLFQFKIKNSKLKVDGRDFVEAEETTPSAMASESAYGNSKSAWVGVTTACKTGTAEYGDPEKKTHAWFTVFAPVGSPQISVTVLLEGGGEGSTHAAPVAKKILEGWFGEENVQMKL